MKPGCAASCACEAGGQEVAPGGQQMPWLTCERGPAIETPSETSPTLAPQAFGAKTCGARLIDSERPSHKVTREQGARRHAPKRRARPLGREPSPLRSGFAQKRGICGRDGPALLKTGL